MYKAFANNLLYYINKEHIPKNCNYHRDQCTFPNSITIQYSNQMTLIKNLPNMQHPSSRGISNGQFLICFATAETTTILFPLVSCFSFNHLRYTKWCLSLHSHFPLLKIFILNLKLGFFEGGGICFIPTEKLILSL